MVDAPTARQAGSHLFWPIAEIDTTEADPFDVLATNRRTLLNADLTTP